MRDLGSCYVTGADGFIGSHLVERLLAEGHSVTALCLYNSQGNHGWLEPFVAKPHPQLKLILGDIRDAGHIEQSMQGATTVFHLASLIAIPYSYVAPQSYIDTNVSGALNVAQAALKHRVDRIIHTSTSEVYGTALRVPIDEDHPLQGQSPYSASKIGADVLMDSFFRSFGLPVTTLRPFNTYGPRQSLRAVIPTIIAQALDPEAVVKLGSLTPTRDFNFVADTVAAFLALARAPQAVCGQTYNAGSGREISINDLASLICQLIGRSAPVESESQRLRPERSEVERLLADSSKLQQATGWKPGHTLEQGLGATIEWLGQHPHYLAAARSYRI